jgi:hypothetical protein
MSNLFTRISECVGKYRDETIFERLVEDLRMSPEVNERPNGKSRMLVFEELGLGFIMHLVEERWIIRGAGMPVESDGNSFPRIQEFGGNLPAGISPDDRRESVKEKLGLEPFNFTLRDDGETLQDSYELENLTFDLRFDKQTERMTNWVLSMKQDPMRE